MRRVVTQSITLTGVAGRQLTDVFAGLEKRDRTLVRVQPASVAGVNFVLQKNGQDLVVALSSTLASTANYGDNMDLPLTAADGLLFGYDADTTSASEAVTFWFTEA